MKASLVVTAIASGLLFLIGLHLAVAESDDPCGGRGSNAEMRQCYATEQRRVNLEGDSLAAKIARQFRKAARDPTFAGVIADELRRAASAVEQSQKTWSAFRDQHCRAVEYSWTTGSGAGTAHEACMFQLGQARLRELRTDFNQESK